MAPQKGKLFSNPGLSETWKHILDLGLGALAHANTHAVYAPMENDRMNDLSILQAAHAAELIIKARIAQEHPLLIFDQLPRPTTTHSKPPDLKDLFEQGRTFQWSDLPDRLWAVTGLPIPDRKLFDKFGNLRNGIQHFATVQGLDASYETLQFVFTVIDPFIHDCWNLFAIDYNEDYEPYQYFTSALVNRKILFLVSPEAASQFQDWEVDWSEVKGQYRKEMLERVRNAGGEISGISGD
jgi:hypothetical protein